MKVGDRVRFRPTSKSWRSRGLDPKAQGIVMDLYRALMSGELKVDVRFGPSTETELAIPIEDVERVPETSGPT